MFCLPFLELLSPLDFSDVCARSMSQGAFVLIAGRLGDVWGHRNMLVCGATWWVIWTLVSAWAPSLAILSLFRGLAGIGGAFMVPNAVALLMHTFPPGKLRNIAMGSFGAMAPVGAAGGSLVSAAFVQQTEWKYLFIFLAVLGGILFTGIALVVPPDHISDPNGKIDWVGAYLGVGGLILFNFAWNQASVVGWEEVYVYVLLIVAILHFCIFIFWEAKVAKEPIMPLSIWKEKSFAPLMVAVFFSFMAFGIFVWYSVTWEELVRDMTLVSAALSIMPFTVGGAIATIFAAWLIPRLAAQHILALGAVCVCIPSIIVATMPTQQLYWHTMFPAFAIVAFSPDLIFTAAQIVVSNAVPRKEQGIAGSLVATLLTYGQSTGLGFGGTVQRYAKSGRDNQVQGFRNALYLAIGFGVGALVLSQLFVRIEKDNTQGWKEEAEGHSGDGTPISNAGDTEKVSVP